MVATGVGCRGRVDREPWRRDISIGWRGGLRGCVGFFLLADRRAKPSHRSSQSNAFWPANFALLPANEIPKDLIEAHDTDAQDAMSISSGVDSNDADASFWIGLFNEKDSWLQRPSSDPMDVSGLRSSGNNLPANDTHKDCECMLCIEKASIRVGFSVKCYFGCNENFQSLEWMRHYRTHFKQDKGYRCSAPDCGQVCQRWGELTRHARAHCQRPTKFPCDVFGCRYGGENGFTRKDKLLSHKRNVHEGRAPPSQLMRKLQPKPKA